MTKGAAEVKVGKVGKAVLALRRALDLTQEELAARSGLPSHVYITRIERGKNLASSYEMRVALAKGFGLDINDLAALLDGKLTVEQARRRSITQPHRAAG